MKKAVKYTWETVLALTPTEFSASRLIFSIAHNAKNNPTMPQKRFWQSHMKKAVSRELWAAAVAKPW